MRLIGYARVSTEEQAKSGLSIAQQPMRLGAYCELHDHTLIDAILDEGVSASRPLARRKGGAELIQRLRAGEADGVVVVRLDRLFRDAFDGMAFFRQVIQRRSLAVCSISELIDTTTPQGRLALTIQLATAQYERDVAVDRASECNRALRDAGKVYGGIPYGCVETGDKHLARHPELWERRDYIVQQLAQGRSLRAMQKALAELAIPSPTGCPRWSLNTLSRLKDHHDVLSRLPMAGQITDSATATPDTGVSRA